MNPQEWKNLFYKKYNRQAPSSKFGENNKKK